MITREGIVTSPIEEDLEDLEVGKETSPVNSRDTTKTNSDTKTPPMAAMATVAKATNMVANRPMEGEHLEAAGEGIT